ncbi:MAG: hypothetical protein ACK5Y2_14360 [Bdellovibrionales bacterium]
MAYKFLLFLIFAAIEVSANLQSPLSNKHIFVCNAGLSHIIDINETVFGSNQLNYTQENLRSSPEAHDGFFQRQLVGLPGGNPQVIVERTEDSFETHITKTDFRFSTEKYGARFFIDICYRGPIRADSGMGNDSSEGIYNLDFELILRGDHLLSYLKNSGLVATVRAECDLRFNGQNRSVRSVTELAPARFEVDSFYTTDPMHLSQGRMAFSLALNSSLPTAPRFCRFRVSLSESNTHQTRQQGSGIQTTDIFMDINKL